MREKPAFRRLWDRLGGNAIKDGTAVSLEGVISDLESLNRATEHDFLVTGERLGEFYTGVSRISSQMGALRELVAGSQADGAAEVLQRILERSRQIEAQAQAGDRALATVSDSARQIRGTLRGFEQTVSMFEALGSLTRIEAARLGGVGSAFENLADEVNALTKNIQASGQSILEESTRVERHMRATLAQVESLRAGELKQLPALTERITEGLAALRERNHGANEAALSQAAGYEDISAAVSGVITDIQFHDITRQQVEHVVEALRPVVLEFRKHRGGRSRNTAGGVLRLQSAQLVNAEQVFLSSVGRILADLDRISGQVETMAATSKTLMGTATGQNSFLEEMECRLASVMGVFDACALTEAKTQQALGALSGTVAQLRKSIEEVRLIEIRIRRISINATIRAVEIGDEGNALSVLAEMMQRVAHDAGTLTDSITQSLDTIASVAATLSIGSAECETELRTDMHAVTAGLHAAGQASLQQLAETIDLSSRLCEQIQQVRSGFSAGKLVSDEMSRILMSLDTICDQAGILPGKTERLGEQEHLETLEERYTMQTERDIHEAFATGMAAPVPTGGVSGSDMDGFGDNVELF